MIPIAFIRETTEKSISLVEEGPEKHQWDKGKERKKDERKKKKMRALLYQQYAFNLKPANTGYFRKAINHSG